MTYNKNDVHSRRRISSWVPFILLLFTTFRAVAQVDLIGFQEVPWGSSASDVRKHFGEELQEIPRVAYARFYAELEIPKYVVANLPFRVHFQMDKSSDKLAQVLMSYADTDSSSSRLSVRYGTFEQLLSQRYGSPSLSKDEEPRGFLGSIQRERTWIMKTTTVQLTYAYAKGIYSRLTVRYFPTDTADSKKM